MGLYPLVFNDITALALDSGVDHKTLSIPAVFLPRLVVATCLTAMLKRMNFVSRVFAVV